MDTTIAGDIIERALQIAVAAHKEQVRKDNGTPYVVHPIMVARIVERYGFGEMVIAAALTHDALEDTEVSEAALRTELGDEVVDIVTAVSEDKSLEWEDRKQQYIEAVVAASEETKAVSVADKIHNAECIMRGHALLGAKVWEKFNRGKAKKLWFERTLCDQLKAVWKHPMLEEYDRLVRQLEVLPD